MEATLESGETPPISKTKSIVLWVFRLILAAVFIYAGALKFLNPSAFAGSIATFQIIPESWSNLVALILPPFEILLGVFVLTPIGVRPASLALIILNIVFLLALLQGLAKGLPVDCGCFGSAGPSTPLKIWLAVARDIGLLAVAWSIWNTTSKPRCEVAPN